MTQAEHLDTMRQHVAVPLMLLANAGSSFVVPGPTTIVVLGVAVPSLSLLFAVIGVGLGQLLAPTPPAPLGVRRRSALVASLLGIAIGIVIATGQQPLVAMSWGIGLGFSGLVVTQTLGTAAADGIKAISAAFVAMAAARIGGTRAKDATDE